MFVVEKLPLGVVEIVEVGKWLGCWVRIAAGSGVWVLDHVFLVYEVNYMFLVYEVNYYGSVEWLSVTYGRQVESWVYLLDMNSFSLTLSSHLYLSTPNHVR